LVEIEKYSQEKKVLDRRLRHHDKRGRSYAQYVNRRDKNSEKIWQNKRRALKGKKNGSHWSRARGSKSKEARSMDEMNRQEAK